MAKKKKKQPKPTAPAPTKKSKKNSGSGKADPGITIASDNRKARHKFEILETVECGMMLMGSEVKSIRDGKMSIEEAYIRVQGSELWLIGSDIGHYANAGMWNHDPRRPRKLLVHRREFDKFAGRAHERGLTLVPLRVYFNARGIAKCLMGLAQGKKLHDKRETLKKRDVDRGLQRAMRRR